MLTCGWVHSNEPTARILNEKTATSERWGWSSTISGTHQLIDPPEHDGNSAEDLEYQGERIGCYSRLNRRDFPDRCSARQSSRNLINNPPVQERIGMGTATYVKMTYAEGKQSS